MPTINLAKLSSVAIFSIFIMTPPAFSSQRTLNYEDAWKEEKFKDVTFKDVVELFSMPDTVLSEYQKECLANSETLTHLQTLNLRQACKPLDRCKSIIIEGDVWAIGDIATPMAFG